MNKASAIQIYRNNKIDPSILKNYKDPDKYCWVNTDDIDLVPISIKLPECPKWHLIEGFKKKAEEQVFEYEVYPKKLSILELSIRRRVNKLKRISVTGKEKEYYKQFWEELEKNDEYYKEEIEWIEKQWYYRLNGKWFFSNGQPTYINGWHWFYLNYWNLENVGLPGYRDRDRRWFIAQEFSYNDTTRPVLDIKGQIVKNEDGSNKLEELGVRICYGTNNAKPRRVGETSKSQCINFCVISLGDELHGGIQGDKDNTAEKIFLDKLMLAYRKIPWFWKPMTIDSHSKTELMFDNDEGKGLMSKITYATTSKKGHYDGQKLTFYHGDEVGKTHGEDVHERHNVVKRCLSTGNGAVINGFMVYTSTVESMDLSAGKQFLELTKASHYEQRSGNGQTQTGLYNIFFPAYDGLEGFIGRYGESIIDSPTPEQLKYMHIKIKNAKGIYMGAKEFLENSREQYRIKGDITALITEKRLSPMTFRECFTPPAKNIFFNVDILEKRVGLLQQDKTLSFSADLYWETGRDSKVLLHEHPNGKFLFSKRFTNAETSQKYQRGSTWYPSHPDKFVACADAYRLEKTDGGRMSNGGGAVKWKFDSRIDQNTDINTWETDRFVITYNNRPTTLEEYGEDMVMMCVYTGALMYPEMNVDFIDKYFKDRGYKGYLLYDIDKKTGYPKNNPGFHSLEGSKKEMFNLVRDYIQKNGNRDRHIDFLKECLDIRNLQDMTNFDLFTACAGALLGEQSKFSNYLLQDNGGCIDIGSMFKLRSY